ncbi:uncharacterized protein [Venturia canescens]|uniref:uncharacterized protein n=1 Tax=Venturia canescens TaxID=32260 RepID=UPI001C9C2B5D|nr:uncharacterized protein LOC122409350 [Venturia canescens]
MQRRYLLGLFLLFGIDGSSSIGGSSRKGSAFPTSAPGRNKSFAPINDPLLSPRQLVDLEQTVNAVYKNFFGPPPSKLTFRKHRDGHSSLSGSIAIIGDTICSHLKSSLKKFGGSASSGRNYVLKSAESQPLEIVVLHQLIKMPLEILPVVREIQDQTEKYMKKNKYDEMGYKKSRSSFPNPYENDPKNRWQNLAMTDAMRTYTTHVSNCLEENNESSSGVKKSLGTMMVHSPEKVGHILRHRLDKALPKSPAIPKHEYTAMQAFACQALVNDGQKSFAACLEQMKIVDECANAKLGNASLKASHDFGERSSENFVRSIKSLDPSCKNVRGSIGYSVRCSESQKELKSDESSYVKDFVLRGFQKSPIISGMADELISTVKKSRIGVDATREIATLISIYENGEKKRTMLLKKSRKNDEKKILRNLAEYKESLATMGLRTLRNINEAILNLESIFDDSKLRASRRNSSSNVRLVRCISDFLEAIVNSWAHKKKERDDSSLINGTAHTGTPSQSKIFSRGQNEIALLRDSHERPFNELMRSMKHLSQSPPPRNSSLLAIAKTFILATMFYECMVILATALHHEDKGSTHQNHEPDNYVTDEWEMDRHNPFQAGIADSLMGKKHKKKRALTINENYNVVTANGVQSSSSTTVRDRGMSHVVEQNYSKFWY